MKIFYLIVIITFSSCYYGEKEKVSEKEEFVLLTDTFDFKSTIFAIDTIIYFEKVIEIEENSKTNIFSSTFSFEANPKEVYSDQDVIDLVQYCVTFAGAVCNQEGSRNKQICQADYFKSSLIGVLKENQVYLGKWQGLNGKLYEVSLEVNNPKATPNNYFFFKLGDVNLNLIFKLKEEYDIFSGSVDTYFLRR